jgi:hypothetical protein
MDLRFWRQKKSKIYSTPDDKRPIKFIKEGKYIWRVVYAD